MSVASPPTTHDLLLRRGRPNEVLQHMRAEDAIERLESSIATLKRHMGAMEAAVAQLQQKRAAILLVSTEREDLVAEQECRI